MIRSLGELIAFKANRSWYRSIRRTRNNRGMPNLSRSTDPRLQRQYRARNTRRITHVARGMAALEAGTRRAVRRQRNFAMLTSKSTVPAPKSLWTKPGGRVRRLRKF